jgi:hypothetical protein
VIGLLTRKLDFHFTGFDWDNGSPDPDIGSDTFSARLTGQGDAPQVASHLHYHGRRWGVAVRQRQTTDRDRRLESLTGFSGCEVGALCAAFREVPVSGICGVIDTKRETVIWWCTDQHRLQVIELSKEQWCDGALIVLLRVVCPLGASTQTATVP